MSHGSAVTASFLFISCLAVVCAADPPGTTNADEASSLQEVSDGERKLLQALNKKIDANWDDVSIEQVLSEISEQASVPVWIDRPAWEDEGISPDYRVTLNLNQATVQQVLHFLLPPLALALKSDGTNGVLEVTTQTKEDEFLLTRVYDISAISKVLEPQLHGDVRNWGLRHRGTSMIGACAMSTVTQIAPLQSVVPQDEGHPLAGVAPVELIHLIGHEIRYPRSWAELVLQDLVTVFTSGKWSDEGGDAGAIVVLPGRLAIRQTCRVHSEIQALLNAIERFVVRGSRAKSLWIVRPDYPHDEDARIAEQLSKVVEIDANDKPLDELLRSLASTHGFRLWIDAQGLMDEGVEPTIPMTIQIKGRTLRDALNLLVQPLDLAVKIEEGTVIVTTQVREDERCSLVIYNTADQGIDPLDLVNTIHKCAGKKWSYRDGEGGYQSLVGPHLHVIRQTQSTHAEIAKLLRDLASHAQSVQPAPQPNRRQRIYPVSDTGAIGDLVRTLPELVPNWDTKSGSIHRLGECVVIDQADQVHDRVGEIIGALNAVHARLHPRAPEKPQTTPGTTTEAPAAMP